MSNTQLVAKPVQFDLSPQNFEQALTFANYLAESDLVPNDFKGKPGNCLIAMQWGSELGLKTLQAIQNLAIINGRPALWGDAVIALVRSSPVCEYVIEEDDGDVATCRVKRRGEKEQSRTFSTVDARQAGLAGKPGPWTQYPKRMRQLRARAFALRDVFADVLRGMPVAEELIDENSIKNMGAVEQVTKEKPDYPEEAFAANYQKYEAAAKKGNEKARSKLIKEGLLSKYTLTTEQIRRIYLLDNLFPVPMPNASEATPPMPPAAAPVAPAPDHQEPQFTRADIESKMRAASNFDELNDAASLAHHLTGEADNEYIDQIYEKLSGQLSDGNNT